MKNSHIKQLYTIGGMGTIAGIIAWMMHQEWAAIVFVVGGSLIALSRLNMLLSKESELESRARTILFVSSVFLMIGAYQMYQGGTSWAVFVFISAVIDLYMSFRVSKQKK